jgi:beta-glucanase (GH16 family)
MHFNMIYIFFGVAVLSGALVDCASVERNKITEQPPTMAVEQTPTMAVEQTPTVDGDHSYWKLIWQDEFDSNSLNEDEWVADVNDWGGGNQELQYYTDRSENVYVENGLLHIVGRKEIYNTREYTSARLTSARSWRYGRFEVRAQLPRGQGIWPAIWLYSAIQPYGLWPANGEIDIMEMLGHEPSVVYGTLHYGDEEIQASTTLLPSQEFHIFALEWEVNELRWYVDDVNYLSVDSWYTSGVNYPAPFDKPFNIVLNLAIGGAWPGNPDEATSFPKMFLIDYVRVYQK